MKVTIIKAEAESEAADIIAQSIIDHGNGLIVMRKIEAAQYIVKQLAQNPNISFIQSQNTMNMLNLN